MPWDPRLPQADVTGVSARAIDVVVEAGDSAPMTPIGINLPNDQAIREALRQQVGVARRTSSRPTTSRRRPRCARSSRWSPDEAARAERWGDFAAELSTNLHEIIGHGSGLVEPEVAEDLSNRAARAVLDARGDAGRSRRALLRRRSADGGARPASRPAITRDIVLAEYEGYARNALVQLRRVREGTTLEEDHMRNRQAIVHWLMAHTTAIERRRARRQDVLRDGRRGGLPRRASAGCWREVQRIKAQADYDAAAALFEAHGTHFEPALRDEVVARTDAPRSAGLHRLRAARARAGARRGRRHHRRAHHVSVRLHRPDAALRRSLRDAARPDGRWPWAPPPSDPPRPQPRIGRSTTCCGSGARCTPTATPRRRSSGRW